jgi:uncharacterized protein HemY
MGPSDADWAALLKLAARAAEKEPKNRYVQNSWGAILFRAGDFEAAREHFVKSLEGSDRDWDIYDWLFLAMAEHKLGQTRRSAQLAGQGGGTARAGPPNEVQLG